MKRRENWPRTAAPSPFPQLKEMGRPKWLIIISPDNPSLMTRWREKNYTCPALPIKFENWNHCKIRTNIFNSFLKRFSRIKKITFIKIIFYANTTFVESKATRLPQRRSHSAMPLFPVIPLSEDWRLSLNWEEDQQMAQEFRSRLCVGQNITLI